MASIKDVDDVNDAEAEINEDCSSPEGQSWLYKLRSRRTMYQEMYDKLLTSSSIWVGLGPYRSDRQVFRVEECSGKPPR